MPGSQIDDLMELWAAESGAAPFESHQGLYDIIDSTTLGDAPWNSFSVSYSGDLPNGEIPTWMTSEYEVWHRNPHTVIRNQLANPDFKDDIDYAPLQEFQENGKRRWTDLMTGNWAWNQAVCCLPIQPIIEH